MRAIKQWWAWHSGPGRGSLPSQRSPVAPPLPYWFVYLGTPPTWSIVTFPFSNSGLAASAAAHMELLLDPPLLLRLVAFHLQTKSSAKDTWFVWGIFFCLFVVVTRRHLNEASATPVKGRPSGRVSLTSQIDDPERSNPPSSQPGRQGAPPGWWLVFRPKPRLASTPPTYTHTRRILLCINRFSTAGWHLAWAAAVIQTACATVTMFPWHWRNWIIAMVQLLWLDNCATPALTCAPRTSTLMSSFTLSTLPRGHNRERFVFI